jgi:hypothetical protein
VDKSKVAEKILSAVHEFHDRTGQFAVIIIDDVSAQHRLPGK